MCALADHLERLDFALDAVDFRLALVERKRTPGIDSQTLGELVVLLDEAWMQRLFAIADDRLDAAQSVWADLRDRAG
jgi:hypothetical protein